MTAKQDDPKDKTSQNETYKTVLNVLFYMSIGFVGLLLLYMLWPKKSEVVTPEQYKKLVDLQNLHYRQIKNQL